MDTSLAPKLLAAALVGTGIQAARPDATLRGDAVMLKLEWIQTGSRQKSENVSLRAALDRPTLLRQTDRTIQVTPSLGSGGSYTVDLKLSTVNERGIPEQLDTQIRLTQGETVVVMGTSTKDGKAVAERLLFLTANAL